MSVIQRKIRSFVRREGRMTAAQTRALDELWPRYGIDKLDQELDVEALFGNQNPVTLEIGFGNGESLATMAAASPEKNFIGIEVHRPGVGNLMIQAEKLELNNIQVIVDDAVDMLEKTLPDGSLDCVQIFFPDPWHKKRHHKRRLIQKKFIDLLASKQCEHGLLHLATDWQDYAEHMLTVLKQHHQYQLLTPSEQFHIRPAHRPETKFERRGLKLGHTIWDLVYRRE